MANYLITFCGHIDERKRPEGFPREVYDLIFIAVDSREGLVNAVNNESFKYIRNQGMSVRKDPFAPEKPNQIDNDRMWVPMHMIAYFDATIKVMPSDLNENKEGSEMVKH